MPYNCEITDRPAQPILSVRTHTPVQALPQALGKAFDEIGQYLGSLGAMPAGAPFVAYYNMDMQDLDIEIGFPVNSPLPGQGEIQSGAIPAGKFATCLHVGPYPEIGPAYEALTQFIVKGGHEPTGVAYEVYMNDPTITPADALQTQVVFPLRA